MITTRTLPQEEWPRLAEIEPFKSCGVPLPDGHTLIQVAEDDGVIIGHTILQDAVHWHWHILPGYQGSIAFKRLFEEGIRELQANAVPHVQATIPNSLPQVQDIAERLGFVAEPGRLYLLAVPPKEG